MPFLVVNSVTVEVEAEEMEEEHLELGEFVRAFDGTAMSSARTTYKRNWRVRTAPMATATADTLVTALKGAPPLACSGDLTGSINAVIRDIKVHQIPNSGGFYEAVSFSIHEA